MCSSLFIDPNAEINVKKLLDMYKKLLDIFDFTQCLLMTFIQCFRFFFFFFFAKRIFATRSLIMYNAYVFIYKDMWHLYFIHSGFTFFFFFIAFLFRQKCMELEGFFFSSYIHVHLFYIYKNSSQVI